MTTADMQIAATVAAIAWVEYLGVYAGTVATLKKDLAVMLAKVGGK